MEKQKFLIALSTYNEIDNIKNLVDKIKHYSPSTTILIINDNSDDGTRELIQKIADDKIVYIERPKKLGLGTAHKLSIFYAIKNNYDFLLTMDADFSHDPSHIPILKAKAKSDNFVIGSRFCEGGKSDYRGMRKIISNYGNFFARKFLGIKLLEITTYFRVYSVKLLRKLPYDELNAQGYSLGVKLVWLMNKLKADLVEVPIHFRDRTKGKSKIPKLQIFISFFDLIVLKFNDFFIKQNFYETNHTYNFEIKCKNPTCGFFTLRKKKFRCLICDINK